MRATIRNLTEAAKRRREESGEAGFSLIELIVVVVILGILAAVAIPVFLGLQDKAEQSAVDAVAGNAASQVAAGFANDDPPTADGFFDNLAGKSSGSPAVSEYSFELTSTGDTATIDDFCVEVTAANGKTADSGPSCS